MLYHYWKQICIILVVLIVGLFVIQKIGENTIKPLPDLASLSEIRPGNTKTSQLQNVPSLYNQETVGNEQRILFGQNVPQGYTEVRANDGTVVAIKKTNPKEFEFTTLDKYLNKYGQTSWNIQTSWGEFGFQGYVYAVAGKIIIAHPQSKEVIEEWIVIQNIDQETVDNLFPPTTTNQGN